MSGFSHLHAIVATAFANWDWQEIGACCLGLDMILFGILAAFWKEAPTKRAKRDG